MSVGRILLIALVGLIGWFAYFLYGKNQEATEYIIGEDCPVVTQASADSAGAVFPQVIYDDDPEDYDIYVRVQNDVAGTFDCFVAMSNTRCDVAGPGLFIANQIDTSAIYDIAEGQTAVIQGSADDLYCTIPDDPSGVGQ